MPESIRLPVAAVPDGPELRGAGLDVVDVDRLSLAVRRSGPRLLDRLFDDTERAACADGRYPVTLAGLFGIKESIVKLLGGMPRGGNYRDVSIDLAAADRPGGMMPVRLGGAMGAWAQRHRCRAVAAHTTVADGLVVSWALALRKEAPC